jgi:acyl carrier protein
MNRRLTTILANVFQLRESEIRPELTKAEVGTWDSLKQMDLVMSLENEYNIALVIPDIIKMVSVESIIEVLTEKGVNLAD